jgi:hypothetical protein
MGRFESVTLTPKKLGVISTYTRELDEHSIPAIEGILREAIQVDTGGAIDAVLLSLNAATNIAPPGLRFGVAGLAPSALATNFERLVADIKALAGALLTATQGHWRKPVLIMNPQEGLAISLIQPAAAAVGLFPFSAEIGAGRLRNFQVIQSGNVPLGMVIAVDAADFVSVGAEAPRFEVSDQATLHMEDTDPEHIVDAGVVAGVTVPPGPGSVRSMFQTDSLALRLIWPLNWALRRTGMVAWMSPVAW